MDVETIEVRPVGRQRQACGYDATKIAMMKKGKHSKWFIVEDTVYRLVGTHLTQHYNYSDTVNTVRCFRARAGAALTWLQNQGQ
jgi:hypothetical protein